MLKKHCCLGYSESFCFCHDINDGICLQPIGSQRLLVLSREVDVLLSEPCGRVVNQTNVTHCAAVIMSSFRTVRCLCRQGLTSVLQNGRFQRQAVRPCAQTTRIASRHKDLHWALFDMTFYTIICHLFIVSILFDLLLL